MCSYEWSQGKRKLGRLDKNVLFGRVLWLAPLISKDLEISSIKCLFLADYLCTHSFTLFPCFPQVFIASTSTTIATTLAEHLSLERADGHYVSSHIPRKMDNTALVAYGGYAIGLAIQAACQSAPDGFRLYSALGHFLRGASTDAKIICIPVELRRTKSFVTYRVTVQQNDQMTGMPRLCMKLLADFHRDEPEILNYSAAPTRQYSHW